MSASAVGLSFTVEPRAGSSNATLLIECEHGFEGKCRFSLWPKPAQGAMWQWDGNPEAPTISPSIDCHGGCGRHFIMTHGKASL